MSRRTISSAFGFAAILVCGAAYLSANPAMAADGPAVRTAGACSGLSALKLQGVTVTAAERVAPGWPFPHSVFNIMSPNPSATVAFCRVAATIGTEIRIEVWLPDAWNRRFEGVGNGGLTGAINYPALAAGVAGGYATASTDTGHETPDNFFDASWVDGHPGRVVNFGYRAHHLMAETAKNIVAAYYGEPAHHAYYQGCSSGGWEGLTEAQRFPGDYDGIVAGAPAINFVKLQSSGILNEQMSLRDPASDVPPSKFALIQKAAVKQCDSIDGLKDGLIDDPRKCRFDPARIACKKGDGPDCLTAAQVARVRANYGPQKSKGGMTLYPGLAWGAPPGILANIFPPGDAMIVRALKTHPGWTPKDFDPDRDIPPMEAELGPILDSMDPDLGAFKADGGKLILYHGWADQLLSPYDTLDYYASVEAKVPHTDDFLRLFMVPGMAHCAGGDGPNRFDALSAVVAWVEEGQAPTRMVAGHVGADMKTDRTRPLCANPMVARYTGKGSIDEAANFVCRKP